MNDTEFNRLWIRVARDHTGIDADPNDLHNARVRTLLCKIKGRMDRLTETDAAPPGDAGLRDFEAGRVKVDMDGPYKGWVSVRHADGQWVTAAKLEPFSMAILSQPHAALGRPAEMQEEQK
jgi:hypothetical protein